MTHTLRTIVIGATVGVLAATGATVAVASIPAANGTITGCVNNSSGLVRIIDTDKTSCSTKTEKTVPWNQAGQPGTDGVSGYERVVTEETVPTSVLVFHGRMHADCPAGKVLTGGGATALTPTGGGSTSWDVFHNGPIDEDTWEAAVTIPDDGREDPVVFQVTAYCVAVAP